MYFLHAPLLCATTSTQIRKVYSTQSKEVHSQAEVVVLYYQHITGTFAIIPLHSGYIAKLPTSAFCWTHYVSKDRKVQKILRFPRNLSVSKDNNMLYRHQLVVSFLIRGHKSRSILIHTLWFQRSSMVCTEDCGPSDGVVCVESWAKDDDNNLSFHRIKFVSRSAF